MEERKEEVVCLDCAMGWLKEVATAEREYYEGDNTGNAFRTPSMEKQKRKIDKISITRNSDDERGRRSFWGRMSVCQMDKCNSAV